MVVLSVPAEVTVILLDIEGTTTPIAFVKVRGGRERGSYLCFKPKMLKVSQTLHWRPETWERRCGFAPTLGWEEVVCGGLLGAFSSHLHLPPSLPSVVCRWVGRDGGGGEEGRRRAGLRRREMGAARRAGVRPVALQVSDCLVPIWTWGVGGRDLVVPEASSPAK